MAYVSIPKDLTGIKTKFFMGLTRRQTVCFGAAAITGLPLFFLIKTFAPVSLSAFVMVLVMLPWFAFAMYEKNGQPLEKFLRNIITVKLKRPPVSALPPESREYVRSMLQSRPCSAVQCDIFL